MPFSQKLQVTESPESGAVFRKAWEEVFAGHLSKKEKEQIFLDQFLWHACSWGVTACAAGEEAVALFMQQDKDRCIIFYQFIDKAYSVGNAKNLALTDLPYDSFNMDLNDLYVMDEKQKWTFVMTHEEQCGPYFIAL